MSERRGSRPTDFRRLHGSGNDIPSGFPVNEGDGSLDDECSVTIPAATATSTATATNTATDTPTPTATETFTPTATATDTPTDTPTATNTATDTPTPTATDTPTPSCTPGVLYDQTSDPAANAVNSQDFEAVNDAFDNQGADDFVVPTGQTWTVQQVVANGVYFNGPGPAASFNVTFYTDAATFPGSAVVGGTFTGATFTQAGSLFTINLPSGLTLGEGTYWVSVQARMDFTPGGQWGWTDRITTSNSAATWQNPGGGFGTPCTAWNRRGAVCGIDGPAPDQVFQIVGTAGVGCATPTATNTATDTPTPTATETFTPTATNTATDTPTPTATETFTPTATNTATDTPTPTATETFTPTATNTETDTPTPTATETFTPTATNTATDTPTPTATETFTPTATNTATDTPTPTATETFTPTATNTATDTPTNTPTATQHTFTPTTQP